MPLKLHICTSVVKSSFSRVDKCFSKRHQKGRCTGLIPSNVLATAVRSRRVAGGFWILDLATWQTLATKASLLGRHSPGVIGRLFGMKIERNMIQTGLQSLFVLLLVPVQHVGGQDLAGVLGALQGQAGEVLVKGDSVGCFIAFNWIKITLD